MEGNGEQSGQVPVEIPLESEKRVSASSSENARGPKCITDNTLPEELIPNILVRLPVKSLIRFTTVCKSWMSAIKDPSFIRAHLTCNRNRNRNNSNDQNATHLSLVHTVLCDNSDIVKYKGGLFSLCHDINDFSPYRKLEFPGTMTHLHLRVHDTCNGLVLLSDDYLDKLYVWNPSISKYLTLLVPSYRLLICALGYDDVSKGYKIVRLTTNWDIRAHVYSLAKSYWGELHSEILKSVAVKPESMGQARVNGVLLWLVKYTNDVNYSNYSLLTFDVASESFGEMGVPEGLRDEQIQEARLSYSRDGKSIALFVTLFREKALDIWVMKEFGVENSWTKVMVLSPQGPERSLPKALCFRRSGEVLLVLKDTRELISLDVVSKHLRHLGISGGKDCSVHFFGESLELLVADPCTTLSL